MFVCVDVYSGSVIKDMNQVRAAAGVSMDTRVLCIDDRPHCIMNGEVRRG